MASISNRGPHQFQVQVRRKGYPAKQLTFESRREAEAWATTIESEMHCGVWRCRCCEEASWARLATPTKIPKTSPGSPVGSHCRGCRS